MTAVKPAAVRRPPRAARRPRWKQGAADSARGEALLDAAAVEFNARGISGASLPAIAERVGLGRAALYYYFDTRQDLAYRCYMRACRTMADDLAAADRSGRTGMDHLLAYLERALDATRAPAVVLSEIPYLGGALRDEVAEAHRHNLAALARFIEQGAEDGSMRAGDAFVLSQAIYGMVSWVPLAEEWVAGTGATVKTHAAVAIADMVENGLAADPNTPFHCALDIGEFAFKPGNAFDRRAASALKVEAILQTASRLFNRRGIDGTSLDDVTAALGATKGAFYHHLPEKRALVLRCAQRAFDLYERFADTAAAGKNGLERAFIGLHLNTQAQAGDLSPLSPLTGLEALPARALAQIRQRAAGIEARFEKFAREGIADGSLRRYEVRTLALAGAGAFGWIPKWRDERPELTPRAIADDIAALWLRGLRRRK